MIVESSFRGWEDARIVLSERGDFEWGILFFFRTGNIRLEGGK